EPDRRARPAPVDLHLLDDRRGVRAVHRARFLRGVGIAGAHPGCRPGRCAVDPRRVHDVPLRAAQLRALLGAPDPQLVPRRGRRLLSVLHARVPERAPRSHPCDRARGRGAPADRPPPEAQGRRPGRCGGTSLRVEHGRLAARRAARRLRALLLARPLPGGAGRRARRAPRRGAGHRCGVAAVLAAAALLTVAVYGLPRLAFLLLLVPTASLLYVMPRWDPRPFAAATFRRRQPTPGDRLGPARFFDRAMGDSRVTFYDDDPNSSVAVRVTDLPQGPDPAIVPNGKPDGSIFGDYPAMAPD